MKTNNLNKIEGRMNYNFERVKSLGSKKAISSIFMVLLLIIVAVGTVVLTYALTIKIAPSTDEVILYKVKVTFNDGDAITVYIGNNGITDTEIIQVCLGESASTMQNQTSNPVTPFPVNTGATTSFDIPYSWSSGQVYYFEIVPASGTPLDFSEQAPQ